MSSTAPRPDPSKLLVSTPSAAPTNEILPTTRPSASTRNEPQEIAAASLGLHVIQSGVAYGKPIFILPAADARPSEIQAGSVTEELGKFQRTVSAVLGHYKEFADRYAAQPGADPQLVKIFGMYCSFLEFDETQFLGPATQAISEGLSAYAAMERTMNVAIDQIERYVPEIAKEFSGLRDRLLRDLAGSSERIQFPEEGFIVVTPTFDPGLFSQLPLNGLRGVICNHVSVHAGGLVKGDLIPTVTVAQPLEKLFAIQEGNAPTALLVDAVRSNCIIANPSQEQLRAYAPFLEAASHTEHVLALSERSPRTADDVPVTLRANLDSAEGAARARRMGLTGVGMVRTEFIHNQKALQDMLIGLEEFSPAWLMVVEQYHWTEYSKILQEFSDCPGDVTFRTLDDGGDKRINSAVNWMADRGLRLSLREREAEFRAQARAIIRAAEKYGAVGVLFPMVNDITEFEAGKRIFREEKEELLRRGAQYDPSGIREAPRLMYGAMIETGGAMLMADSLARSAHFLSIGTNDLMRYIMATDRVHEMAGHDSQMHHPAMLRAIRMIVRTAREARPSIEISVCGDAAADPFLTPMLLGAGVTSLSMRPPRAPQINHVLSRVRMHDCSILFDEMAAASTRSAASDMYARFRARFLA